MKCMQWVVLSGAVLVAAGCASGRSPVTGTEGVLTPGTDVGAVEDAREGRVEPVAQRLERDSDNDGIADVGDQCPDTGAGVLVDVSGCDIVTGVIDSLKFEPNESALSAEARVTLGRMVEGFLRYPDVVISVEGHTDNRGAAVDNLELSKQRVLSVVRYMVSQGMSPERIKPYGYGESRPRAANATAEGREQNRRIEINIVEGLL